MTRFLLLTALAVITPIRRGLSYVEGKLVRTEYELRRQGRAWFVGAVALVALSGCAGAERHARSALDIAAHAVVSADAIVASTYEQRAPRELAASTSLDDYRERMRTLDGAVAALDTSSSALLAAEAAIDAATADGWYGALACAAESLVSLVDALVAAGIDPPDKLRRAISKLGAIEGLAQTLCRRYGQ